MKINNDVSRATIAAIARELGSTEDETVFDSLCADLKAEIAASDVEENPEGVLDVFVTHDKDYSYEVGSTEDDADEAFSERIGNYPRRMIHLKLKVPPIERPEYTFTVPAQPASEPVEVEVLSKLEA